ncbi:MAG: GMP synthase [Bacteroidetes bacterium]|nr:GMP synthase [Bacteroidota bacterium]
MPHPDAPALRVAVLDLYDGQPNQGMRCIEAFLEGQAGPPLQATITYDVFDVRGKAAVPDLSYDAYISTGGPGSPWDGLDQPWETAYFDWLEALWQHNAAAHPKKHALFICHSFQLLCRHFEVGQVTKRPAQSFGIFEVHRMPEGYVEPLFDALPDPFWAADFRRWQVVQPDHDRIAALGASLLAREQPYEEYPFERALMGVRLSPEMVGVQFHPEADPEGMLAHFRRPAQRKAVIASFCEARYQRLIARLKEKQYLTPTHETVIPTFLRRALRATHRTLTPAA